MDQNTSAVSNEAQLMEELKKLEQSARQYQQEVSLLFSSRQSSRRPLSLSSATRQVKSSIQLPDSCYCFIVACYQ